MDRLNSTRQDRPKNDAQFENTLKLDGAWIEWTPWTTCSIRCGGTGTRSRTRSCTDPEPLCGGMDCVGDPSEDGICGTQSCDVDGNWSQWTEWTSCSVTCDFGIKSRSRSCTEPAPGGNGADCPGSNLRDNFYQEDKCMDVLICPVDGNWTSWSEWSECSVPCGGGFKSRNHSCTNPVPAAGGKDCDGNTTEVVYGCNSEVCGVNGNWGEWSGWQAPCTVTCGGGIKVRNRTCDNPARTYGGNDCRGSSLNTIACNTKECEDGSWTAWSMWSVCSKSCKGGVQARGRSCTNPRPGPEGKDCPARDPFTMWQRCNTQPCPINGRWTHWTEWSNCPVSCGGGFRLRVRNCTNPPAQWGGRECRGIGLKQKHCNTHVCPFIGVPHNVRYTSQYSNITITWEVPLEYVWPINYYTVYFRKRTTHNQTLSSLVHSMGVAGYQITRDDLKYARPTKGNSSFKMTIRNLDPFTNYELCMTTKYHHIEQSEHSKVTVVKTKRFPWPAPPDPITIEYGDAKKEGEYKVLIRWTENTWANYSKPLKYLVRIRDVNSPEKLPKGWITLAEVTTEITGYLLRESKKIDLQNAQYILQVFASNRDGVSDPANCRDIISYYLATRKSGPGVELYPITVNGVPTKFAAAAPLSGGTQAAILDASPLWIHLLTCYFLYITWGTV
ncbi:coadhesin-like [Amphiura filiformis]|uniref:coadhesin-like n=1 Tax=Amphiura filiformis TaxID=82378 RepID=UPI003B210DED